MTEALIWTGLILAIPSILCGVMLYNTWDYWQGRPSFSWVWLVLTVLFTGASLTFWVAAAWMKP